MDYKDKEKKEYRAKYADIIEKENPPQEVSHTLYVIAQLREENETFRLLDADDMEQITNEMFHVATFFKEKLDELGKENIVNSTDFDLFFYSLHLVGQIVDDDTEKEKSEKLYEIYLTALSALFQLWMDDVTTEDVVKFYRNQSDKDFPTLKDHLPNYKWAQEHGIYCNDTVSLMTKAGEMEMTADDEAAAFRQMDDMCKFFDELRPTMVSMMQLDDQFVEDNLKDCRTVFMITQTMYAALPMRVDVKKACEDPIEMEKLYDLFTNAFTGKSIRQAMQDKSKKEAFQKIFAFTFQVAVMMEEQGTGFFARSRNDLYEDLTSGKLKG